MLLPCINTAKAEEEEVGGLYLLLDKTSMFCLEEVGRFLGKCNP